MRWRRSVSPSSSARQPRNASGARSTVKSGRRAAGANSIREQLLDLLHARRIHAEIPHPREIVVDDIDDGLSKTPTLVLISEIDFLCFVEVPKEEQRIGSF